jgi:CRP-like cAMP-binding protein
VLKSGESFGEQIFLTDEESLLYRNYSALAIQGTELLVLNKDSITSAMLKNDTNLKHKR